MIKKIYLSPSNQTANAYAAGSTTEAQQCYKIAQEAKAALERCGFTVKLAAFDQNMWDSIRESNSWGADLHICLHTNAGGGEGTEVFVYDKSASILKYAQPIYNHVAAVTPGIDRGVKVNSRLAEINSTTATTVYCECEFHDRPSLAEWIIANVGTLGEAVAKGVCEAFGVAYIDGDKPETAATPYRVRKSWPDAAGQLGAYNVYDNAKRMADENPGYTVYDATGKALYSKGEAEPPAEPCGPSPSIEWDNQYDAQIAELQRVLNGKGAGLSVDGIAGPNTYDVCQRYTINSGDAGPLTRWVQARLNGLGFDCGAVDGIAGSNTMAGVAAFQRRYQLGVGYLGGTDWYYLIR